mgnify:CR=1 FL=1
MNLVIDTNILVSALWSPSGIPAQIVESIFSGKHRAVVTDSILQEYHDVLHRPKFSSRFSEKSVSYFCDFFRYNAVYIPDVPSLKIPFVDEDDRIFFELASHLHCFLITGNLKHYPDSPLVVTASDFCRDYL